jgi:hypothetical protein
MRSRVALAVCACVVLASCATAPPPPAPQTRIQGPVAVGPYRIGASIDVVRAERPGLAWRETTSPRSGKATSISAPGGLALAGQTFDATITPGIAGAYKLAFESTAEGVDRKGCRARVDGVVRELETTFGRFGPDASDAPPKMVQTGGGGVTTMRSPEGYLMVVGAPATYTPLVPTVRVGSLSQMEDEPTGEKFYTWRTKRIRPRPHDHYDISLEAEALNTSAGGNATRPDCRIDFTVDYTPPQPFAEDIAFSSLRMTEPSISVRHHSLDGVDVPAEGAEVTIRCAIDRKAGVVFLCANPDGETNLSPLERAAVGRVRSMRLDERDIDPDNPVVIRTEMKVRLLPSERKTLSPPAKLRPESDVKWAKAPTPKGVEMTLWPTRRFEAPRIEAKLRCQIQTDLSVICVDQRVTPATVDAAQIEGLRLAQDYKAEARLADGSPAAGAWVEITMAADKPPIPTVVVAPPRPPPPPPPRPRTPAPPAKQ